MAHSNKTMTALPVAIVDDARAFADAARVALSAAAPDDCPPRRWIEAQAGLKRFVEDGWADLAFMNGWAPDELYRVPEAWSQIGLTGAALLIGDRKVVEVSAETITIETLSGSRLKFRRSGWGHIA
jgi:hypothetical protein